MGKGNVFLKYLGKTADHPKLGRLTPGRIIELDRATAYIFLTTTKGAFKEVKKPKGVDK